MNCPTCGFETTHRGGCPNCVASLGRTSEGPAGGDINTQALDKFASRFHERISNLETLMGEIERKFAETERAVNTLHARLQAVEKFLEDVSHAR